MAPNSVVVTDGSRRMVGDIIETYSHSGETFAKIETRSQQTGFVKLPTAERVSA